MSEEPTGALRDKWTGETVVCPHCGKKELDKFTGGPDIKAGTVKYTDFIYHCRNCDANYTEEEYNKMSE